MKEVYIKVNDYLSEFIIDKYFKNKDLITIQNLVDIIDKQQEEIDRLEEKNEDLQNSLDGRDYDPEIEIPQIHGPGISW